jgi:type III secretion protein D
LGARDDFDIYVGDWSFQAISLQVAADGSVQAQWPAGDELPVAVPDSVLQDDNYVFRFKPFAPVRFGAVIICVGSSTDPWPSDADILQLLFKPEPPASESEQSAGLPSGLRKYVVIMTVALMACLGTITLATALRTSQPPKRAVSSIPLVDRVRQAVEQAGASRQLTVRQDGATVVVRGLLDTRDQATKVNQKIDALDENVKVVRQFRSAEDAADMIRESLSAFPLEIKKSGPASFSVEGRASDPARVKAILDGLQGDLTALGVTVTSEIKPATDRSGEGVTAVLVDESGTSYTQTRDGVKHLMFKSPDAVTSASANANVSTLPATKSR